MGSIELNSGAASGLLVRIKDRIVLVDCGEVVHASQRPPLMMSGYAVSDPSRIRERR